MESFPKIGMKFEQSRSRLRKYDPAKKAALKDSLIHQVRLNEGEQAAQELNKEFSDSNNHSSPRVGASKLYSENYDRIFKGSA